MFLFRAAREQLLMYILPKRAVPRTYEKTTENYPFCIIIDKT